MCGPRQFWLGAWPMAELKWLSQYPGEEELLSHKMREHLFVRANHTVPLGMISLSDFIEALAKDLAMSRSKQDRHRRKLLRLEVRLTQVQEELSQTDSSQTQR